MEEIYIEQIKCLKEMYESMNKELELKEKMIDIAVKSKKTISREWLKQEAIKEMEI